MKRYALRVIQATGRWRGSATNRRVIAAAITVGAATLVLKFVSAGRELIVAYSFGTSDALDAFIIALLAPSFVINVQIAAFSAALMPIFIRLREEQGEEAARSLAQNALCAVFVFLLVMTLALALFAEQVVSLLGFGFDAEKQAFTLHLFLLLLPIIFLQGLIKFYGILLNAGHRFALAAISPVMTPLLTIALLTLVRPATAEHLVAGVVLGSLLELLILMPAARRRGLPFVPRWRGLDGPTRTVLGQYLPTMLGALAGSASLMVDQSMAAMLEPGSAAALSYGSKLVAMMLALTAAPLSTAILPYLSGIVASGDGRHLAEMVRGWVAIIFLTSIPLAILLVAYSEPLVRLVFERGAFDSNDTQIVAQIQMYYVIGIPAYLAGVLGSRVLNAMSLNQIIGMIGVMNFVTNIAFNLLFMRWLGLPGIALSTSFVYLCSCIVILLIVRSRIIKLGGKEALAAGVA